MLTLDGSKLEGGGQIIRTALALSTLTGIPFEAYNIRAGREKPGLKAQHLHCILALQKLCNAKVGYAELGSTKLRYLPGKICGKTISIDIGTAGSVSLLLQSILLPAFFADSKVHLHIKGGTAAKFAMPYDYFENVLLPYLRKFCEKIDAKQVTRGYYPAGNGEIDIIIRQKFKLKDFKTFEEFRGFLNVSLPKFNLIEQGTLQKISGVSHASADLQNAEVAERQTHAAKLLLSKLNCPVQIRAEYSKTMSTGSGITLLAIFSKNNGNNIVNSANNSDAAKYEYNPEGKEILDLHNPIIIGADALGERGKRAEEVGKEAADKLIKEIESKAPVDVHLADNLIPFIALFPGNQIKVSELSMHTKTNIWVIEQFLGKCMEVDEENKIIRSK
ncbi:RNA 3'-terminal phosphate cyclase [Candidatus Woesearchaeota archaeon]|nr:RNA 3'-terminal phosphate cyclase [Candidatus Woesearchaeota archaeon]